MLAGHIADAVIAGYPGHPEQALAVRAPMPLFHPPLVCQKRRALHEKHRKREHAEIRHAILAVSAPAAVRKRLQTCPQ